MTAPQRKLKRWIGFCALGGLASIGLGFLIPSQQIWLSVAGAAPILVCLQGASTACEKCGGWWSQREVGREKIDSFTRHEKEEQKTVIKDARGNVLRTETRQGYRPVDVSVYNVDYRCRYCGAEHTERKERKERESA